MSRAAFLIAYIAALPLTYILPYFGSNSIIAAAGTGGLTLLGTFVHMLCFLVLIIVAAMRGPAIGKPFLWAFPVIAGVFDFVPVLSWIPFVPTAMHAMALVTGANAVERSTR